MVQGLLDYLGAVGPTHLVSLGNSDIQIHGRDGTLVQVIDDEAFWGAGGFDDRIIFDPMRARFVAVRCTYQNRLFLAVTRNSDPTGTWDVYIIEGASLQASLPDSGLMPELDYPQLGFNIRFVAIGIVICGSPAFGCGEPLHHGLAVIDKAGLFDEQALRFQSFLTDSPFKLAPAMTYDPLEPDLRVLSVGTGRIEVRVVSGATDGPTLSQPNPVTPLQGGWSASSGAAILPQRGTQALVESDGMDRPIPVVRNGRLWSAHSVSTAPPAARTGIMWMQISAQNVMIQQGFIGSPGYAYSVPTVAVNRNEDVLIGFTRFSPDEYPSAGYAFRSAADPLDTFRQDRIIQVGRGPLVGGGCAPLLGRCRLADLSMSTVDVNDEDLWTLQAFTANPEGGPETEGAWALVHRPIPCADAGSTCDDNNACTGNDTCAGGICVGVNMTDCAPPSECVRSLCNPLSGQCVERARANGALCTDGVLCETGTGFCNSGQCLVDGGPVNCAGVTQPDSCMTGFCHPQAGFCDVMPRTCDPAPECQSAAGCIDGQGCTYTFLPDGTPCNNGQCRSGQCSPPFPDAGQRDAGGRDAGRSDAGRDAGQPTAPPAGHDRSTPQCGCSQRQDGPPLTGLWALAAVTARRLRKR
ncbi:MAG: hypothetical protein HY904_02375 [Deltaproteobacteria bacterium]|nr:hypothetical protein [Deltaproteobacteria bacterium]